MGATRRQGFTVVEAMFWAVLLLMVAALAARATSWAAISWTAGVERLDRYGMLRLASLKLASELAYGRALLYPAADGGDPAHQLLFIGPNNEFRSCFVDTDGQMKMWSRGQQDGTEILVQPKEHDAVFLDVRRPSRNFVQYRFVLRDEKGKENTVAGGIWLRNHE